MSSPFRIAFVCGCLEPGRDGVGDYTRRLAAQLIRDGQNACAISIKDRWISSDGANSEIAHSETQYDAGTPVMTHRFNGCNWSFIANAFEKILLDFEPTVMSLQFVPYSFHSKGFANLLGRKLQKVSIGIPWHIMFHEVAVRGTTIKNLIYGKVQRLAIQSLCDALQPEMIHTSIGVNQDCLAKMRLHSHRLPLFGNIPITNRTSSQPCEKMLNSKVPRWLLYFGTSPKGQLARTLVRELETTYSSSKDFGLVLCSRASKSKLDFLDLITGSNRLRGFSILDFDFLDDSELSTVISASTVGIARSSPDFIGKSGTAMAMLEHGLRVWIPLANSRNEVDIEYRKDHFEVNLNAALNSGSMHRKNPDESRLSSIAARMIADLEGVV